MIVRLVLAVIVAGALLGAAMPVVEDAQRDVATTDAERASQSVVDAIESLYRSSDPVPRGIPGAKRTIRVAVPETGSVTIGGGSPAESADAPGNETTGSSPRVAVSYHVPPSSNGRTTVPVAVRVVENGVVQPADTELDLRDSRRIVLRHELVDGEPVVTVESV